MYEHITYEALLERMLGRVNKSLDRREGSLLWDANAPAAVELQNLYIALDMVLNESFADTASREYLLRRAKERGLTPYPATPAVLQMTITPANLSLAPGSRFSIGSLNYAVTENLGGGLYALTCETAGEAGNSFGDAPIPIDYIQGLESCEVTALLVPGEDEEDTESFRQRYFASLDAKAFGGNQVDYLEKVGAIPGVGGAKVYRVWNGDLRLAELKPPEGAGEWIASCSAPAAIKSWLELVQQAGADGKLTVGGTVRVVIIDAAFAAPSATLLELVQTTLDPEQNAGEGLGLAPIGHVVKVEGVQADQVNISVSLQYQEGWSWEDAKPYAEAALAGYFLELAAGWAKETGPLVVRISQIESRLLALEGIVDAANAAINGSLGNYTLPADHIPVMGAITAATLEVQ